MHRSILLSVAVTAALLIGTSSASAVSVTAEGGALCTGVTVTDHAPGGGCGGSGTTPAGNPLELRSLFGIMYLCDGTFTYALNGNGEGYIYNQTALASGTTNPCSFQPQAEGDGHKKPWPFELSAENGCGAGCDTAEAVLLATGPFGLALSCHIAQLQFRQTTHLTGQLKTAGVTHSFCENDANNAILGVWNLTSAAPGFEVG